MANNPTPTIVSDLITSGEGLCTGLDADGAAVGIKQNTGALARPELDTLKAAQGAFTDAETATTNTYAGLHSADAAASTFIGTAVHIFSVTLGNTWSDAWLATGLPDNSLGVPRTQDKRYAALGKLNIYLTNHPDMEISTPKITVTAALADTLYKAITTTRKAVADANTATTDAKTARDAAVPAFSERYSATVQELGHLLSDTDARWYKFDLNRPADPAQPEAPAGVTATPLGGGRVLLATTGARRANSFDFYCQIIGTDPAPVKLVNTDGTQYTAQLLPVGKTASFTVTGVNNAGEGQASAPVSVIVT